MDKKVATSEAERSVQKSYWKEHSVHGTVEDMMLDSQAAKIDISERPEILSALGDIGDKTVLELGAGIGRFTSDLAKTAKKVIACDFMENLLQQNQASNSQYHNISYLSEDATRLSFSPSSLDVVFSNWLLMYLANNEVESLFRRALSWLRNGGVLFFRESCYRPAGDKKRDHNPSHYRSVIEYFSIIDHVFHQDEDGKYYKFKLLRCATLQAYVKLKKNHGQIFWKFQKVEKEPEAVDFRHFLDHVQYSKNGILRYEKIFGDGYVSTGGEITTAQVTQKFTLSPGQTVLDIGCGLGGGDYYLARQFEVDVLGIDLSANMFTLAVERACLQEVESVGNVFFEVADCTTYEFAENSFDAVYSRDTLLHIHDKPALFQKFLHWLKPGGQLLITDYCRSSNTPSDEFAAYIKQRGYDLHPVPVYGEMLKKAGFVEVSAEDVTESIFFPSLKIEFERAENRKQEILSEFSEEDFAALKKGWKDKIHRAQAREQLWGLFFAKKPIT